jgi:rod shape-determining protein MreC
MFLDYRYEHLSILRSKATIVVYPIQWLVHTPVKFLHDLTTHFAARENLIIENTHLKEQQILLNGRLQILLSLRAENDRLRSLLQSSPRTKESLLVAEIMRIDPDPFMHHIIVNKGSVAGVSVGQVIIDDHGILGTAIEVNKYNSRVMLVTDASFSVSVESVRSGVRAIVAGTGTTKLELQFVHNTADLHIGDLLVTSGLGGKYIPGYPVGTIERIDHDPGAHFANILLQPSANLDKGRQVLIVGKS